MLYILVLWEAMYSVIGGCLGTTAKLGLWLSTLACASVKGLLDMFLIHVLLVELVYMWLAEFSFFLSAFLVLLFTFLSCLPCCMFEWPPLMFLFLWQNLSNLIL